MIIVSWNIEWMNDWFAGANQVAFRPNNPRRGITDTAALATRVAQVIIDLSADVLTIQEGPSDPAEMQLFVDDHLEGNYTVLGGLDGRAQKVYALIRNGGQLRNAQLATDDLTRGLLDPWESDVDGDEIVQHYEFTRVPLTITGQDNQGNDIRILSLHTKSKYVHNGAAMFNDPYRRQQFIHEALINRRRISSEAMRTRRYLNHLLDQDPQARIIVTGDLNDGPGMDHFEQRYLTHNVIDILLGTAFSPETAFEHAFVTQVPARQRFTARFDDYVDGINDRPLLLDHILVSPSLAGQITGSGIAHAEFDAQTPNPDGTRQERASDHRPVFAEL